VYVFVFVHVFVCVCVSVISYQYVSYYFSATVGVVCMSGMSVWLVQCRTWSGHLRCWIRVRFPVFFCANGVMSALDVCR